MLLFKHKICLIIQKCMFVNKNTTFVKKVFFTLYMICTINKFEQQIVECLHFPLSILTHDRP